MSSYYQELDAPHFVYDMQPVEGIDRHTFRGPIPNLSQPFFACIGGAQTMGRFAHNPYPQQLSEALAMPCLNLGLGGAGPRFALQPNILTLLQQAQFVVIQIFSGRSASNSLYDSSLEGRNHGRCVRTGKTKLYEEFLADLMLRDDVALLHRIVHETREDYTFSMNQLAQALDRPKVLLWLSRRKPAYTIDCSHQFGVSQHYPQLIDEQTVNAFCDNYDAYVECPEPLGMPQPLWLGNGVEGTNRDQAGQVWNSYYPTPQMHTEAARQLLQVCRDLLQD